MPAPEALPTLLALEALARLPRTGWAQAGVPAPESIADHVLGTCCLALALAPRADPPVDLDRALALALVHDLPEARTGDLPRDARRWLGEEAKRDLDAAAAESLLPGLSPQALERWREYHAQETRAARLVKLCDRLHLGVEMLELARAGQRHLGDFAATLRELDCGEFPAAGALRDAILAAAAAEPAA